MSADNAMKEIELWNFYWGWFSKIPDLWNLNRMLLAEIPESIKEKVSSRFVGAQDHLFKLVNDDLDKTYLYADIVMKEIIEKYGLEVLRRIGDSMWDYDGAYIQEYLEKYAEECKERRKNEI